jgi:hypothetical protein
LDFSRAWTEIWILCRFVARGEFSTTCWSEHSGSPSMALMRIAVFSKEFWPHRFCPIDQMIEGKCFRLQSRLLLPFRAKSFSSPGVSCDAAQPSDLRLPQKRFPGCRTRFRFRSRFEIVKSPESVQCRHILHHWHKGVINKVESTDQNKFRIDYLTCGINDQKVANSFDSLDVAVGRGIYVDISIWERSSRHWRVRAWELNDVKLSRCKCWVSVNQRCDVRHSAFILAPEWRKHHPDGGMLRPRGTISQFLDAVVTHLEMAFFLRCWTSPSSQKVVGSSQSGIFPGNLIVGVMQTREQAEHLFRWLLKAKVAFQFLRLSTSKWMPIDNDFLSGVTCECAHVDWIIFFRVRN